MSDKLIETLNIFIEAYNNENIHKHSVCAQEMYTTHRDICGGIACSGCIFIRHSIDVEHQTILNNTKKALNIDST